MRKLTSMMFCLFCFSTTYSQVGVNTNSPKTTLHILPSTTNATTAEGIIAPNLTRSEVILKDQKYTPEEKGAMIYVTDLSGVLTTKTDKITKIGYYYFDGDVWQPFAASVDTLPQPWFVQGGSSQASANTENIYQMGKVAIGTGTSAVSAYNLQIAGTSFTSGNARMGSSSVVGAQTVGTTLAVTGATNLNSTVDVAGTTNLNGATNAKATTITGQLRYTMGAPAANKVLISTDANGNVTWGTAQSLITIPTQPWLVQGGTAQATSNAQAIYQTGSVGIGTNTAVPAAYKFQVTGASNITGNSRVGSSTVVGNEQVSGNMGVTGTSTLTNKVGIGRVPATGDYILAIQGNTYLSGNSQITGSLGIGTTPNAQKLSISSGGTPTAPIAALQIIDGYQNVGKYMQSDANGVATWQSLPTTATTEPWQVQGGTTAATTNAQAIYQTGSVGIGANTAVPAAYKFQVTGASNITGNSRVASSTVGGNETVGGTLNVTGATALSNSLTVAGVSNLNGATNAKATTITGQLRYTVGAPAANKVLISTDANGNVTWGTAQSLITIPTQPWLVQGGTTAATTNAQAIYQTGSVGIGANTAVPAAYKFQVTGASNITGNSRVASSTVVGNETVGGTLNVTGATALSNSLTVAGVSNLNGATNAKATNITGTLNYKPGGTAPTANTYLRTDAAGNASWQAFPSTPQPWLVQGGTTQATTNAQAIYQTGSVGIGASTAVPAAYKFQVTGASNITGNSRVGSSTVVGNEQVSGNMGVTGTSILTGNVGIGTTTLTQKLNVSGNAYVTGSLGLGVASPAQKLHVAGNEYVTGISKIGGNTSYNSSAQLELSDNNKGFLPNRVALTNANVKAPVTNAVAGMFVYNTATVASQGLTPGYYYWTGTSWTRIVDKIPSVKVNMYYSTSNVKGGPASGSNQASMVSIPFSASQKVNSPVAIKLPETGSYAFNVKLYSAIGSTGPAVGISGSGGKVIAYVGIWVNGTLQDVSEVFVMLSTFAGGGGLNASFVTNVVLGCTGNEGDTIDIRLGYFTPTVPSGTAVWSQGKPNNTPISDATSMIFWKL